MTDWDAILQTDGPAIWRSARRVVGNDADADECFQQAFLQALQFSRRRSVRHWRAFLTRLAVARAIDRLRQKIRQAGREESADWENVPQSAPLPVQQLEEAELSQRLREALAEIPPQQAEVFCLACLDGWSHKEIAEHLAMSVDSVGVNVHRARQRLQERLAFMKQVPG